MTREEIILMAREAGGTAVDHAIVLTYGEAQRFAALVAAAEREACAQLCADYTAWGREWGQDNNHMVAAEATNECAAAIRARSNP